MDTNPRDPKKEALRKKEQDISSRYHHLRYAADDYDRARGKGPFKKAKPDAQKLLDGLLDEKIDIAAKIATVKDVEDESTAVDPLPVPIV